MSTTFKKKLSYFISGQLPEYIVAEYPDFVQFLTSYYKFLETSEQVHDVLLNNASWIDIDSTLDIFLPEYKKQYAADIPNTSLLAIRRLLKYISEYYEAKGSENATELFFRFMYNDQASVVYPGDYILRASDGKWSRKKIIKIDTTAFQDQDIFTLKGKRVKLKFLKFVAGTGNILNSVETSCFNVVGQIEPNIYQLEVDIDPNYAFPDNISSVVNVDINDDGIPETIASLGDYDTFVYLVYNTAIYGVATNQIVSVTSIDDPGSDFRVDDSYLITNTETSGNAVIRIKEVTAVDSGISEIQLVNTGHKFAIRVLDTVADLSYFSEDYAVSPDSYATDSSEYTVSNTFTATINPIYPRNLSGTASTLKFEIGIIRHEIGTFKDSAGFLSDINYLQDNYYYQPYSYVIRSQQPLNTWKDVYTRSNHPAGFKIFSELQFTEIIPQVVNIRDDFEELTFEDSVITIETVILNTQLFKTELVEMGDIPIINVSKPIADSVTNTDSSVINFGKRIADSVTGAETISKTVEKPFTDIINSFDTISKSVSIPVSDIITSDDSSIITIGKPIAESASIADVIYISAEKVLTESLTVDRYVQDYVAEDYFAQTYVGDTAVDIISINVEKVLTDTVSSTDSPIIAVTSPLIDTITATDAISKTVARQIADTIASTDTSAITVEKPVFDTISNTDTSNITVGKIIAETVTSSEIIDKNISKLLVDTTSAVDTSAITIAKPFADVINAIDLLNNNFEKVVSDLISTSDSVIVSRQVSTSNTDDAIITDSLFINAEKIITDSATAVDISVINVEKSVSDTITVNYYTQDYVGEEYFAEAYVGTELPDLITKTVSKPFTDVISNADSSVINNQKIINDVIINTDSSFITVAKTITDIISSTDAVNKSIANTIADNINIADTSNINAGKVIADSVTTSDSVDIAVGINIVRAITDSVITTETLNRFSQDYVAEDYFEQPYVGTLTSL